MFIETCQVFSARLGIWVSNNFVICERGMSIFWFDFRLYIYPHISSFFHSSFSSLKRTLFVVHTKWIQTRASFFMTVAAKLQLQNINLSGHRLLYYLLLKNKHIRESRVILSFNSYVFSSLYMFSFYILQRQRFIDA